jgi:hypothetical protein
MPKPRMSCGMLEEVLANVISCPLSAAGEERVDQRSEVGVSKRRAFKSPDPVRFPPWGGGGWGLGSNYSPLSIFKSCKIKASVTY